MHGRVAWLGLLLALLVAPSAHGQADLRWHGTVTVQESVTADSVFGEESGAQISGSGSYTIEFSGETPSYYSPGSEFVPEQFQFEGLDVPQHTGTISGGSFLWTHFGVSEDPGDDTTCRTTVTFSDFVPFGGSAYFSVSVPLGESGTASVFGSPGGGFTVTETVETASTGDQMDVCDHDDFDLEERGDRYLAWLGEDENSLGTLPFTRDDAGRVLVSGSFAGRQDATGTWTVGTFAEVLSDDVTAVVDLQGLPPGVAPDEEPDPDQPKDPVTLTLDAQRIPPGTGQLEAGGKSCRVGVPNCTIAVQRGTEVRVAANADVESYTISLYGCDRIAGSACFVKMNGDRTVSGYFGKEPDLLPPTLLTADQKIEIAGAGADAAADGSQACILAAGILATRGGAAATEGIVAGMNAIRQILQDCAMGVALTGSLGMLLKVDPPDPDFRAIGYPEAMAKARARRCRVKRCGPVVKAARRFAKVRARQASLIEAAAVAANRYGNAVTAGEAPVQHTQRGAYATYMALSAELDAKRAKRGRAVAKALRRLGVKRLTVKVPRRVKAPRTALDRLVRKRLAVDRADALSLVRGVKPAARRIDLVKRLRAPARTTHGLAGLPALDLVLLIRAIAGPGAELDAALASLTGCDANAATAVAGRLAPLGAEPRLLAQRAADELARRAALPGCAA